jgi:uncharacterized membrane protein required for colicin V production
MDDYVLLDILLGLIVALFAAIGFWRGAVKEIVVTAGVFAGSALAFSWADPWGGDLADLVDMRADVARIVVAAIALIAATLVLGYGGSALVGSPDVGLSSRLLGAGLAAINGGLLLHYCLWNIERFLTDEGGQEALDQSEVSRVLLRHFGWLLVGAAGLGALAIVAGQMVRRRRAVVSLVPAAEVVEPLPASSHDAGGRQRPARLPRVADAGKYEPVARGYDPASERYAADAPSAGQTMPLPPVDAANLAYGGGRGAPAPGNYEGDEWYRRAPGPVKPFVPETPRDLPHANGQHPSDRAAPPLPSHGDEDDPSSRLEPGANGHSPMTDVSPFSWVQRTTHPGWAVPSASQNAPSAHYGNQSTCRVCQAELGPEDSFCPRCGTASG